MGGTFHLSAYNLRQSIIVGDFVWWPASHNMPVFGYSTNSYSVREHESHGLAD